YEAGGARVRDEQDCSGSLLRYRVPRSRLPHSSASFQVGQGGTAAEVSALGAHKTLVSLIFRFYEPTDLDAFFKSAHLIDPMKVKKSTAVSGQCKICYERRQLTGLACGHVFCYECWDHYLVSKVTFPWECSALAVALDRGRRWCLPAVPGVQMRFDHRRREGSIAHQMSASPDQILHEPLRRGLCCFTPAFNMSPLQSNPLMTRCPGTDCGFIVELTHANARPITCDCGYTFCFFCGHAWHDPVGCDLLKKWLKKCSEPANWLNAKTEVCPNPKCQLAVEKDDGSDHMMCGNVSCRFDVCPICLGPWSRNGCDACIHYDDTEVKRARNPQE
ncbi:ubiquitin-conjugating enzyme E2-binding protein 1, partial [Aphelenchoides avenae]